MRVTTVASRADCEAAGALFDRVWGVTAMVPTETIIATLHGGGHASLAEVGGTVVGATWGFLATHEGRLGLHSHVTGVLASHANGGVGLALKHHQWQWASEHGLDFVTWTFDPLVRRNAYFNLVKLGAVVTEYHEEFYGVINDGLNRGERTDRVFVMWPVSDRPTPPSGCVVPSADWSIATPPDIEALRRTDPDAAQTWRDRQRADLRKVFDGSWRIAGYMADGSSASRAHRVGVAVSYEFRCRDGARIVVPRGAR
ncbi:MAG: GNAT family N-acetyltransferase [Ilumatobacteraceae bacterium]